MRSPSRGPARTSTSADEPNRDDLGESSIVAVASTNAPSTTLEPPSSSAVTRASPIAAPASAVAVTINASAAKRSQVSAAAASAVARRIASGGALADARPTATPAMPAW
jgi:hypothetical protein